MSREFSVLGQEITFHFQDQQKKTLLGAEKSFILHFPYVCYYLQSVLPRVIPKQHQQVVLQSSNYVL